VPRYEVVGFGRKTGRKRVCIYEANNHEDVITMAANQGIIVDVNKIRLLPESTKTETKKSPEYISCSNRNNFLTKIWAKSPIAFRNAFLTTLGVISALILSIYIYGNILHPNPKNIKWAQKKLAINKLFLVESIGQNGIFRGRNLIKYKFSPDATRFYPYLSVWADDNDNIVGVSAVWLGGTRGSGVRSANDITDWLFTHYIHDGFENLTGFYMILDNGKFYNKKDEEIYDIFYKKWYIIITRYKINETKYSYLATAQTW